MTATAKSHDDGANAAAVSNTPIAINARAVISMFTTDVVETIWTFAVDAVRSASSRALC
jgi:hypothetical protein